MTISELGSIGEFIGSIVVFITMGYLAVQIRQNTRTMAMVAEQESSQWWYELNRDMSANSEIIEIFHQGLKDITRLSDPDRRKFIWFIAAMFYRIMGFHKSWLSGHLSDDSWKPGERFMRSMLQYQSVDQWWQSGFYNGSDNFVAYVENIRTSIDPEWDYVDIARIFDSEPEST